MHRTKKSNQWHFGTKAHFGVDFVSGLLHTVIGTGTKVNDITQGDGLLHGKETVVFADAGYQGAIKRSEAMGVDWHVAMRPGIRRALSKQSPWGSLLNKAEQVKAGVRAKVEHPFHVIKYQFGFSKATVLLLCDLVIWHRSKFALISCGIAVRATNNPGTVTGAIPVRYRSYSRAASMCIESQGCWCYFTCHFLTFCQAGLLV